MTRGLPGDVTARGSGSALVIRPWIATPCRCGGKRLGVQMGKDAADGGLVQGRPVPGEWGCIEHRAAPRLAGHFGGPLGGRGHRPGHRPAHRRQRGKDAGQRVASPAPSVRVGNRGETVEQVRGFGCAQRGGRGPGWSGRGGSSRRTRQGRGLVAVVIQAHWPPRPGGKEGDHDQGMAAT